MRVDDIRGQLRKRGVSGISAMRKPDLVKQLVRSLRSDAGGAGRRSTGPAGRAAGSRASAGRAAATKKSAARAVPSRAKAAPANKSAPAKRAAAKKTAATKRATPARKTAAAKKTTAARSTAARRTSATARTAPARKAPAKKAPARPAAKRAAPAKRATAKSAAPAKRATASRSTGTAAGGIRTGRGSGRSVRSSQVIASIADRPERPGRSLITANHEVIQRWARARGAKPATIAGTEREGRAGVLTFNIPGYRESSRIREITWDEWFHTFDLRRLNLIYQEQMRDGRQSNFFRTESPDREDG
ncbi:hypothetical protein [Micromonospora sp. NPDC005979]|uniref:hypothetical protein n=1 Tax=Micromonospora sp. NPDC005979 TaxID=3156726 RepID=UPI0033B0392E